MVLYNEAIKMISQRPKTVYHRNNLSGYIANWRTLMYQMSRVKRPVDVPRELVSFGDNTHDLSVMLSYLDMKLTTLEKTTFLGVPKVDYQAYGEARSSHIIYVSLIIYE